MGQKRIAILGSSGGNLYNLGGNDPMRLLQEISQQCDSTAIEIAFVQFIGAQASMDNIKKTTPASLYEWDSMSQSPHVTYSGTLQEVNEQASFSDEQVAKAIQQGEIDGIILMSADPDGTNKQAIAAAIEKKVPIVGTGGTSMATTSSKGGNVVATSGTTGTTNRTRAISFISSLSKHWGIRYRPVIGGKSKESVPDNPLKRIQFRGIMLAALPAFISLALILALSKIPMLSGLGDVFDILIKALPVVLAAIAARQISGLDEIAIVSGIVAGVLSVEGGIIGGIIAGILAGLLVNYLFQKCISWNFPTTTVNIVAGGLSGLIAGLFVYFLIAPLSLEAGKLIRSAIEYTIDLSPILAGLVAGLLIWPAILGGVYHAAILPIVLLEMEKTGNSFLGAIDMTGLVMVSAGITLANMVAPRKKGEGTLATPGFLINMGFGTFVEAAYPFMFSNKIVFAGAIGSAGLAGMLVGLFDVRGTAYVPSLVSPFLSNNITGLIIAMAGGFITSFIITLLANKISKKKEANEITGSEV
ncbi:PTS sugar transporter [Kroppenstedtia pulmonis]|uniref:PTS sugar transporter n=1 Tax=Kroppenstedtia pulmonis TaxID=1380685 RepID=A0A7D3Y8R3_9BACL|nr:PTS sugar transporter [Kroppenstedtia pulmonis]QKG83821.1 PTS sugar transporter [Kroppenstedtia pulmonis]